MELHTMIYHTITQLQMLKSKVETHDGGSALHRELDALIATLLPVATRLEEIAMYTKGYLTTEECADNCARIRAQYEERLRTSQ